MSELRAALERAHSALAERDSFHGVSPRPDEQALSQPICEPDNCYIAAALATSPSESGLDVALLTTAVYLGSRGTRVQLDKAEAAAFAGFIAKHYTALLAEKETP